MDLSWRNRTYFVGVTMLAVLAASEASAQGTRRAPPPAAPVQPAPAAVEVTVTTPTGEGSTPGEVRITLRGNDLPLGAILSQIARSSQLALVAEKEVKMDSIVASPSLENLRMETALDVILTPFGYGYSVNHTSGELRIVVFETRTFKVSVPMVVQQWNSSVANEGSSGGGSSGGGAAGGGAAAGGSSGGGMGANVSLTTKTETTGLWAEIEKSLGNIVGEGGGFSANRVAGFVTVRALPSHMQTVASYLDSVNEEMGRTVVIETKVLQVDLSDDRAAGIDWNIIGKQIASIGLTIGGLVPAFPLSSSFAAPAQLSLTGAAGEAFIKAIEQQGDLHLIAQPTLVLGNNLPSIINVGTVQSYVASVTTTVAAVGGVSQTSVTTGTLNDGLVMSILPRVMEDGTVSLALSMVAQDILGFKAVKIGENSIELPQTTRRAYSGVVRTKIGESLVIGGMIVERETNSNAGLPFLARIPFIGWLFGVQEHKTKRSELVVTITARSIDGSAQRVPPGVIQNKGAQ